VRIAAGAVRRSSFHSSVLRRDWRYAVYTPPGRGPSAARCPTLYLLHGSHGCCDDFVEQGRLNVVLDHLIASGRLPPVVVAMPDGGDSWWLDHGDERMESATIDEFIPHVERSEGVIGQRRSRVVGGVSMGGFGALRYALKHPDKFAAAALFSPAVYAGLPDGQSTARACAAFAASASGEKLRFDPDKWRRESHLALFGAYLARNTPLRFSIDCGAVDELGLAEESSALYRLLRDHGQPARARLSPGGHDWPTWSTAFEASLPYVFSCLASDVSEGPHQPGR